MLDWSMSLMLQNMNVRRIDIPGNRGNAGIFIHELSSNDGSSFNLVEKRSTSTKEKVFYLKYYTRARSFNPPI